MALTLGSPAPALKAGAWIQGDPVSDFQPGRLYVIEFWATWCGPCRGIIPHISLLSGMYAEHATFLGFAIWERGNPEEDVTKFVKMMGDRMTYPVAIDTADNYMAEAWMMAAGRQGIPSSFIVDGQGRIAWIGHPASGLEDALRALIDGTYDPAETEKQLHEEQLMAERRRQHHELLAPFSHALEAKNYAAAIAAVDEIAVKTGGAAGTPILKVQAAVVCGEEADALKFMAETPEDLAIPAAMTVAQLEEATDAVSRAALNLVKGITLGGKPIEMVVFGNYAMALLNSQLGDSEAAIAYAELALQACRTNAEAGANFIPMVEALLEQVKGGA